MKRTFKEYLDLIKQYDIDIIDITIASAVNEKMLVSDYERMCRFIKSCYLEDTTNTITIDSIIDAILALEDEEELTDEEIYEMREYQILDKASYFV